MELNAVAVVDGCDPPNPWLYGGEVAQAFRRGCIGTSLWREAERRCTARGAVAAFLDVDVHVEAQRLYLRLGYEVVAEGTSDTWLMRKWLW